jgi:hypothetical protein
VGYEQGLTYKDIVTRTRKETDYERNFNRDTHRPGMTGEYVLDRETGRWVDSGIGQERGGGQIRGRGQARGGGQEMDRG